MCKSRHTAAIALVFTGLVATNGSHVSVGPLVERRHAPETRRRDMPGRVRVGSVADFADGKLHAVDAAGTSVVVGLAGGSLCAARNRCPHLGFSLTKGPGGLKYADGQVVCPWHNSRFDLASGENLDWAPGFAGRDMPRWSRKMIALGRKPSPLTTYEVTVEGDDVYVEL
jgi:nitrite reductase/ring-hydroxylating ferredoxin subunit